MLVIALLMVTDPEKNRQVRPAHLRYIDELYRQGKVEQAGPFADRSGGMVLYRVESLEEAERYVREDPVIREKARTYQLHVWEPLQFPLPAES